MSSFGWCLMVRSTQCITSGYVWCRFVPFFMMSIWITWVRWCLPGVPTVKAPLSPLWFVMSAKAFMTGQAPRSPHQLHCWCLSVSITAVMVAKYSSLFHRSFSILYFDPQTVLYLTNGSTFSARPCVPWVWPHGFFEIVLTFWNNGCSRVILDFPCPSPGVSHFFKDCCSLIVICGQFCPPAASVSVHGMP